MFRFCPLMWEIWTFRYFGPILASLINSAKLHELDPQTYLADILERIVSGRTKVNALHELLPWNWKAARAAQDVKAAA